MWWNPHGQRDLVQKISASTNLLPDAKRTTRVKSISLPGSFQTFGSSPRVHSREIVQCCRGIEKHTPKNCGGSMRRHTQPTTMNRINICTFDQESKSLWRKQWWIGGTVWIEDDNLYNDDSCPHLVQQHNYNPETMEQLFHRSSTATDEIEHDAQNADSRNKIGVTKYPWKKIRWTLLVQENDDESRLADFHVKSEHRFWLFHIVPRFEEITYELRLPGWVTTGKFHSCL